MKIQDKETFDKVNVFGMGQENSAFAQYFIGNSYLNPLTKPGGRIHRTRKRHLRAGMPQ